MTKVAGPALRLRAWPYVVSCCAGGSVLFLLGARRIKLGAVEAARTRRPRGLASTVPHPAPPTGEDSNSLFPPSVFVRGFSYLGLRFRRPVWIAQNGSWGGPGNSVQIKGRSPRLVVGSSTMAQIPCWVARARRRKKHHWWSPKHNEWRDLELPFVKTSDKMRKGCLVAAGQPIVVPATDGAGVCVVRTATRSAGGLRTGEYAVRSSMHDSGSLFPRGNLHHRRVHYQAAHMSVAVKVPNGPGSSDLQCQTYLHRQTVGNCRVGSGGRSMPGIAIPGIDTYAPHSNVEAPPSAMVLAACGRRQDTGGVSRKACRPSFAGEPKAKPAVSRCG